MLALASGLIAPESQAVLFYVYTENLAALRNHLLASGVADAGEYDREVPVRRSKLWGTANAAGLVAAIRHPFYMSKGEMRVEDLDGYTLLIGQLE